MHSVFVAHSNENTISIVPVITDQFDDWLFHQSSHVQTWVKQTSFKAVSGTFCLVPKQNGTLDIVLIGIKNYRDFRAFGALSFALPEGTYEIIHSFFKDLLQWELAALGWGLGHYQFIKYKKSEPRLAKMVLPKDIDALKLEAQLSAITLARDLINTPAEDMGPEALEIAVRNIAKNFSASVHVITGDELLEKNYPAVHAVGRASHRAPRVIDLRFGVENAPKITLIGKGVCFDTGGLDLKNPQAMLLMKKDMSGAAMMLALSQLIMSSKLPVRLRLLIGAVDNVISSNSYRPGDIVKTRSGKTVEIKNTDAEGRVVLSDLLTEACSEKPEIIIDFATLTGAARVALGEDLPAMYAQQKEMIDEVMTSAELMSDPVWPMPLISDYAEKLKSDIADIANVTESPWGGSITAALFLQSFVDPSINWMHFDVPAWNFSSKPARPVGGEVFGIRALFHFLNERYFNCY